MSTPESGAGGQRGAQPVRNPHDKRRPWWLWLVLAVVAVAILLLLLSRCGGNDNAASGVVASATSAGSAATSEAGSAAASAGSSEATTDAGGAATTTESSAAAPTTSAAPAAGAGAGASALSSNGTALLPLTTSAPDGILTAYVGQPATANAVTVQSVPADEGFWVGSSATDRVWVQLTGSGESPYTVRAGYTVSFTTGQVVANPAGYPATAGLAAADGAAQLTSQAAHVEVAKDALQLTKG